MQGQEAMPQLEKNPLDSIEADLSVDLKQLSGYTLKSQGTFLKPDKDRVKISAGAINAIDNLKQKIINRRKERSESQEQIIEEVDAESKEESTPVVAK